MKKISFLILPEKGHINPYMGPAQVLAERGNDVTIAAAANISAQIKKAGLKFDSSLVCQQAPTQPMRGESLVQLISNKLAMRNWIKELLLAVTSDDVKQYLDWILKTKPDILVLDPLAYTAVIAAELSQIPWVSMSNSLNPILESDVKSELLETLDEIEAQRAALFSKFGVQVEFKGCDALSKHLTLAFCTAEFVGPRASSVHMVGPSMPTGTRGDGEDALQVLGDDRPLIYASFGSQIYYWPEIFQKLIEATRGQNWHLKLSVGDLLESLPSAEHLSLYRYAPQLEILPRASVFITHGGANSVMEALRFKTRLWVSPMCNDQFHQAHYIQKAGIGWVEDIRTLTVDDIKNRIQKILTNVDFSRNSQKIWQSYQVEGAQKSADLIEGLL